MTIALPLLDNVDLPRFVFALGAITKVKRGWPKRAGQLKRAVGIAGKSQRCILEQLNQIHGKLST